MLNIKNPKHPPVTTLPNTVISFTSSKIATTVNNVTIIAVILDARPSIPSVKFIAFVAPNIINMVNGTYSHIGNVIYSFNIGTYVSSPKFNILVIYV